MYTKFLESNFQDITINKKTILKILYFSEKSFQIYIYIYEDNVIHYFCIFSTLAKFQGNQRLIAMSLIICLNSSLCSLKQCIER